MVDEACKTHWLIECGFHVSSLASLWPLVKNRCDHFGAKRFVNLTSRTVLKALNYCTDLWMSGSKVGTECSKLQWNTTDLFTALMVSRDRQSRNQTWKQVKLAEDDWGRKDQNRQSRQQEGKSKVCGQGQKASRYSRKAGFKSKSDPARVDNRQAGTKPRLEWLACHRTQSSPEWVQVRILNTQSISYDEMQVPLIKRCGAGGAVELHFSKHRFGSGRDVLESDIVRNI